MADRQAIVILHPLRLPDLLRTLRFKSDSDRIDIGRASKRENKNLAPATDNGLFDSRVMSRIHATIRVSLEQKAVYIRDPGSMHGTWINEEKIPIDKDVVISNGDVLKFGVEVIRGNDTFPPLAVRCQCQWLELPDVNAQKSVQTSNTFCVPDDDDDEIEITALNTVSRGPILDRSSESNDSLVCSDSEDSHSVVVVSSVMTSPLKNDGPKDAQSFESAELSANLDIHGSSQSHIDLAPEEDEQPLATPRMTPPSVQYDSVDQNDEIEYYDEYFPHSSDESSVIDSDNWEVDEENSGEEDTLDVSVVPEPTEHDAQIPERVLDASLVSGMVERIEGAGNIETQDIGVQEHLREDAHLEASSEPEPVRDCSGSLPEVCRTDVPSFHNPVLDKIRDSPQPVSARPSPEASCPPLRWPLPPGPMSHSGFPLQPSGKLFDHSLAPFSNGPYTQLTTEQISVVPRYSTTYDLMPFSDACTSHAPYNDGPFANNQSVLGVTGANTSKNNASSDVSPAAFMDPLAPMRSRTSCSANTSPGVPTSKLITPDSESISRKRKATEMEVDSIDIDGAIANDDAPIVGSSSSNINESSDAVNEETCLPDAQPQSLAAILNASESQLTALSIPESSKADERPAKRTKTSGASNFRSHATTALIGAVVGAVGTIAALASLPPDYFV